MTLTSHDLIFFGLTALAAFVGARFASRGKPDTAGIARLEQKIDSILTHLALTGDSLPMANAPAAGIGGSYSAAPAAEEAIISEIRRGRKIEAIKLYREQHQVGLKEAKDAVESLERTLH